MTGNGQTDRRTNAGCNLYTQPHYFIH